MTKRNHLANLARRIRRAQAVDKPSPATFQTSRARRESAAAQCHVAHRYLWIDGTHGQWATAGAIGRNVCSGNNHAAQSLGDIAHGIDRNDPEFFVLCAGSFGHAILE